MTLVSDTDRLIFPYQVQDNDGNRPRRFFGVIWDVAMTG
jgi:hypothetical protein